MENLDINVQEPYKIEDEKFVTTIWAIDQLTLISLLNF
jgi:hypothetical protein